MAFLPVKYASSGGGGGNGSSYIKVTTGTEQGGALTLSIGGATYSGTFSAEGEYVFQRVTQTGIATFVSGEVTVTLNIEYYGYYEVELTNSHVYGVEWDGTSSSVMSRTDDASEFIDPVPAVANGNGSSPFDGLYPWSDIERVEDASAGTLVKIPKFWYNLNIDDDTGAFKLQICDKERDGFKVSPAHMDRGDGVGERDYVYVGAYHCATSTYKSTTGVLPQASQTREAFRTSIHNLGSDIWQWDKAMLTTIQMLYLVEYADWNSQAKIGYGCSDSGSVQNSGLCDAMAYHTGTSAVNRTTYGHVRYRYIEGLWDNVRDWLDGIYLSGGQAYSILNPANFSDTTGGTYDGFSETLSSNNIKRFKQSKVDGLDWYYWPVETISNSNYDTYVCDNGNVGASNVVVFVGGYYVQYQYNGLFCQNSGSVSYTYANIGSRLQKLPSA